MTQPPTCMSVALRSPDASPKPRIPAHLSLGSFQLLSHPCELITKLTINHKLLSHASVARRLTLSGSSTPTNQIYTMERNETNLCGYGKSTMKHRQRCEGNLILPYLDYGYPKCMLDDFILLNSQVIPLHTHLEQRKNKNSHQFRQIMQCLASTQARNLPKILPKNNFRHGFMFWVCFVRGKVYVTNM